MTANSAEPDQGPPLEDAPGLSGPDLPGPDLSGPNPRSVFGRLFDAHAGSLAALLRERTGRHSPADPGPVAITGAALSCLLAAKATWIAAEQRPPFGEVLDLAMAALRPA